MNIFTNLLFLQGQQAEPHPFDEDDDRYSHGYGNAAASHRFFAPLGHARAARKSADATPLPDLDACCALAGCG
ncbi:hypothetical protein AB4Y64_06880 [Lysobacter sp. TAF61]|uniref:hypothetical protein n=1 Tax=Lysobacter sp. TAF61 TaxID=3233072 RepID=UPI003F99CE6F